MFSSVYLFWEHLAVTGPAFYIFTPLRVKSSRLGEALEVLLHSFLATLQCAALHTIWLARHLIKV